MLLAIRRASSSVAYGDEQSSKNTGDLMNLRIGHHRPKMHKKSERGLLMLLQRAEYDAKTQRAYVEFRARHGDAIATTIFSFRTTERLSKERIREEVVRMARHLLKRAAAAT